MDVDHRLPRRALFVLAALVFGTTTYTDIATAATGGAAPPVESKSFDLSR